MGKKIVNIFDRIILFGRPTGLSNGIKVTCMDGYPTSVAITAYGDQITGQFYSLEECVAVLNNPDTGPTLSPLRRRSHLEISILTEALWEIASRYNLPENRTEHDKIAFELDREIMRIWGNCSFLDRDEQLRCIDRYDILRHKGTGRHRFRVCRADDYGRISLNLTDIRGMYTGPALEIQSLRLLDFIQELRSEYSVKTASWLDLCPTTFCAARDAIYSLAQHFSVHFPEEHPSDKTTARAILRASGLPSTLINLL